MMTDRRRMRLLAILENKSVPEPNTGCRLWLGGVDRKGYGLVSFEETSRSHRAAWILQHGPIPPGLFVCHKCDVPACINVQHLFLGTHEQNMADMVAKGRSNHGSRSFAARLTEEEVSEARRRAAGGETSTALALVYGVSRDYMRRIISGKAWRSHAERIAAPRRRPLSPAARKAAEDMRERAARFIDVEANASGTANVVLLLRQLADALRTLPLEDK